MKDDKKSISIQHVSMLCRSNFSRSRVLHLAPQTMNPSFLTCLFPGYSSPLLQLELVKLCVWLWFIHGSVVWRADCVQTLLFTLDWFFTVGKPQANSLSETINLTSSCLLFCFLCLNSSIFPLHLEHLPVSEGNPSFGLSHKSKVGLWEV